MEDKPPKGSINAKLINIVMRHSKLAHELFGTPIRNFEELYAMKINDLRNLEAELRIQIGIKRNYAYRYEGA